MHLAVIKISGPWISSGQKLKCFLIFMNYLPIPIYCENQLHAHSSHTIGVSSSEA
jgi:hypothetical protein